MFACALLAAVVALLAPPWLAWREAQRQAWLEQAGSALGYARAMLRRSDELVQQSLAGMRQLARFNGEPCSAAAQGQMRRVILTSTYIKAIGHVRDGVMRCSSLGAGAFSLGTHTLRASNGLLIYSRIPFDDRSTSPLMAIERDGFAVLFHSDLPLDGGSAGAGMSLAVLHVERRPDEPITMARGFIDRAWVARLGSREQATFADGPYLVAMVRSASTPTAGVAALPLADVRARRDAIALRLVPAGVVAGAGMAAAMLLLVRRQASLAAALRAALRHDEFFLLYQPVVDLRSGCWVGVEALLRWRRATGELIGPDLFIPIAEQTGTIARLTERVLQLVEQDMRHFLAIRPAFHVALNLSPSDLHSDAIVGLFDAMFARGSVKAANLIVEITERGTLDLGAAQPVIGALRERGIGVAIDDFGTGYAGLSYLESLRVDFLKIDRSFIEAIGTCAPTNQVVGHIIAMATAMELAMVAEGIETLAQADYLRERGVQLAQGWMFGKPQHRDDVVAALAAMAATDASPAGTPVAEGER
ncbi:cyclic diguanylate phosphodiesterase [Pseudoduganella dura]|nr:cyclic diguanylate phosphodiesterase [Pseudoduganella dura]